MSSYIFSVDDIKEAYRILSNKDPKKRAADFERCRLLALVPHGTEAERVHALEALLISEVQQRWHAARLRLKLGESRAVDKDDVIGEIRKEFRMQDQDQDTWTVLYFYRVHRWNGTILCNILADLARFGIEGARRQLTQMEDRGYYELYLAFRQRFLSASAPTPNLSSSTLVNVPVAITDEIPRTGRFIHRPELDTYYAHLLESNLLIIVGPSGTGKTWLAAQLARRLENDGYTVIWISIVGRTPIEQVLEQIGDTLMSKGEPTYRNDLRNIDADQGIEADRKFQTKVNVLISGLMSNKYALVLDNAHWLYNDRFAETNEKFEYFFRRLCPHERGRLPIIMTTREPTGYFPDYRVLAGLSKVEASTMLRQAGIVLDEDVFERVYKMTQGHPQLLTIVIGSYRENTPLFTSEEGKVSSYRNWVKQFVRTNINVQDYLSHIFKLMLSDVELRMMNVISVFHARLDMSDHAILDIVTQAGINNIGEVINSLRRKNLVSSDTMQDSITCHDLITEYFYGTLPISERDKLHRDIALYYQRKGNAVEESYHWYKAGDYSLVEQALVNNADQFLTFNTNGSVLAHLQRFITKLFIREPGRSWSWRLHEIYGKAHEHLGAYNRALEAYRDAFQRITQASPLDQARIVALHIRYAQMLERCSDSIPELNKAIAVLKDAEQLAQDMPEHLAQVLVAQALILQRSRSQPDLSIPIALRAKDLLPLLASKLIHFDVFSCLGHGYFDNGDVQQAHENYEQVRSFASILKREYSGAAANALNDLATFHMFRDGNLKQGLELILEANEYAHQSGSIFVIERTLGNVGLIYHWRGDYDGALRWYTRSLDQSQKTGHDRGRATDIGNIGVTEYKRGNREIARQHLKEAYTYFRGTEHVHSAYCASYLSFLEEDLEEQRAYVHFAWQRLQQTPHHPVCSVLVRRAYARAFPQEAVRVLTEAITIAQTKQLILQKAVCAYELSLIHPIAEQRAQFASEAILQFQRSEAQGWLQQAQAKSCFGWAPQLG